MKIIVNGDDFGMRDTINESIVELVEAGIMSSATIMVKRDGGAFNRAVREAKRLSNRASFGLHLDLDEFFLFDETGHFGNDEYDRAENFQEIISVKKEIIRKDIILQIKSLRGCGITISHIDGHHFIHQFLEVLELIVPLLREQSISAMRFHRDFYRTQDNRERAESIIRKNEVRTPGAFFDLGRIASGTAPAWGSGIAEVMAHTEIEDHGYGRLGQYHFLRNGGLGGVRATFHDLEFSVDMFT